MKKLKSLFCLALMFIAASMMLVGCEPNNHTNGTPSTENPTTTTITLAEAKQTIVNALAINESEIQQLRIHTLATSSNSQNRNIFIKLNAAEISLKNDDVSFGGIVQRNFLGNWTKYSLCYNENYGYYDGNLVYFKGSSGNFNTLSFEETYFSTLLQSMDCLYIDLLFLDDAFTNIYGNTVNKNFDKESYSFTMDIDMSKYVDYVMTICEIKGLPTKGLFGDGEYRQRNKDEGSVELIINFDNNHNILGLNLTINSLASDMLLHESKININKYHQEITEPQWVIDWLDNK